MPPQLRIVVTGDTNSGKSTLNNAVIGRELLPVAWRSETSVITYVVPQHVDTEATPVLHAYRRDAQGLAEFAPAAEGDEAVRSCLQAMNESARVSGTAECIECRVDSPLRASLNVFVPPASEWEHVQLVDIGGPDDVLNPKVQACADLAYALSHRLVVCVRYDQVTSRSTQQLIEEVRAKAPYHFDDALATHDRCPIIFVVTQADQALKASDKEGLEVMRQSLRALLHTTLHDCPEVAQKAPILVLSAKQALASLAPDSGEAPAYEWRQFEELLILCAGLKRDIVQDCKLRRASFIHGLQRRNLELLKLGWPYNAASMWESRKDMAVKAAYGSAIAATSIGTAVAVGVYLSAASAASLAASQAAAVSAEASAATAAASSWWAWLFGIGGAEAAAATSAAAAAEAVAASTAATAGAWAAGSAIAGGLTGVTLSAAAVHGAASRLQSSSVPLPGVVADVTGFRIAHAAAVGVRDARMVLRSFKFTASAGRIKAGRSYRDVHFYPDGIVPVPEPQALGAAPWPFQLRNAKHGRLLTQEGGKVQCSGARDRSGQLWWAVPAGDGAFALQSAAESLGTLRAEEASLMSLDKRMSVRCTPEVPAQHWRAAPGSLEGTVRLVGADHGQGLFYDGWSVGCYGEPFPDQDWVVVPKLPLYIGDFKQDSMTGRGQFFWPNGAPLFQGKVREGHFHKGFVFDERSICHGHLRFSDGVAKLDGPQPEDADGEGICLVCRSSPSMAGMGKALRPCAHGVVCEACSAQLRECPYCHAPVEGVMRVM